MAFTFAHPAAVLPLRRYADPTALVIGSMIPDAGYFLGLTLPRYFTHGPVGLFGFCLPLGLLTYWLFKRFLRDPLVGLAPLSIQVRLPTPISLPSTAESWIKVGMAILLGALTHAAWDDLTNRSRPLISLIPWFGETMTPFIGATPVRGYIFLDQITSILGTVIVLAWVALWFRRTAPKPSHIEALSLGSRMVRLGLLSAIAIGISLLFLIYGTGPNDPKREALAQLAAAVFPAATATLVGYAGLWHLARRLRSTSSATPRSG